MPQGLSDPRHELGGYATEETELGTRSRRPLIKQAVLPPNPDQTTRARRCWLVLGAYLANFS